jgi:hypothetical protein
MARSGFLVARLSVPERKRSEVRLLEFVRTGVPKSLTVKLAEA